MLTDSDTDRRTDVIIWIDGTFGSGKTTLVEELRGRLPDAMVFDPEDVGYLLMRSVPMPATEDFQDMPVWRPLVAEFLVRLRQEYGRMLLVPMTVGNAAYREEIFGLVRAAGQRIRHVYLDVTAEELRRRIEAQVLVPDDPAADAEARAFRLRHVPRGIDAVAGLPADTLVLTVGDLTPAELADRVQA